MLLDLKQIIARLDLATRTFTEYTQMHEAKGPGHEAKVTRNQRLAIQMREAHDSLVLIEKAQAAYKGNPQVSLTEMPLTLTELRSVIQAEVRAVVFPEVRPMPTLGQFRTAEDQERIRREGFLKGGWSDKEKINLQRKSEDAGIDLRDLKPGPHVEFRKSTRPGPCATCGLEHEGDCGQC